MLIGRYIPGHRVRLYQEPVSCIQQILVTDNNLCSSCQRNIVITDAQTIGEIMTSLRSAKPYYPNHPTTKWRCTLVIADAKGESYVDVVVLSGEGGSILYIKTAEGFIFDRLRSSTIGQILERIVRQ